MQFAHNGSDKGSIPLGLKKSAFLYGKQEVNLTLKFKIRVGDPIGNGGSL